MTELIAVLEKAKVAPPEPARPVELPAPPVRAPEVEAALQAHESAVVAATPTIEVYRAASLPKQAGDFFAGESTARVVESIRQVLAEEAPVHVDLLARRIADAWGKKVTERFRERLIGTLELVAKTGAARMMAEFVWAAGQEPSKWTRFRGIGPSGRERDIELVPVEELANAARHILVGAISLPEDELLRQTARLFGVERVTALSQKPLTGALAHLAATGRASEDGGRWVLREGAPLA